MSTWRKASKRHRIKHLLTVEQPSRSKKPLLTAASVITQLARRATGETLTYLAAEDKFTLEGGPRAF